jgi:hypothetical protein
MFTLQDVVSFPRKGTTFPEIGVFACRKPFRWAVPWGIFLYCIEWLLLETWGFSHTTVLWRLERLGWGGGVCSKQLHPDLETHTADIFLSGKHTSRQVRSTQNTSKQIYAFNYDGRLCNTHFSSNRPTSTHNPMQRLAGPLVNNHTTHWAQFPIAQISTTLTSRHRHHVSNLVTWKKVRYEM